MYNIKATAAKHREIIAYIVCGGITTLVNYVTYFALSGPAEMHYATANAIAWAVSVAVAYITNKVLVFRAMDWSPRTVVRESVQMAGARLATLGLETAVLWLAIDVAGLKSAAWPLLGFTLTGGAVAKLVAGVLVTITNYFVSKLWIFKHP